MILKDIYAKPIERKVNPAVSVTLLDDPETTKAEYLDLKSESQNSAVFVLRIAFALLNWYRTY